MSHKIELPIDKVLSDKGTEWHGLAKHVETITEEVLCENGLFFPIVTSQVINWSGENTMQEALTELELAVVSGESGQMVCMDKVREIAEKLVFVDTHKTVSADLRTCRPDLAGTSNAALIPLHIPKKSYTPIPNKQVFEALSKAFGDNMKLTTAGTLNGGKVFFMSMDIGDSEFAGPRGEKFNQFLNASTSHDGTGAVKFQDSRIRIVCNNTLQASLKGDHNMDFTVSHSVNSAKALDNVSIHLEKVFAARAEYFNNLEYFNNVECDVEMARNLASYYLATWNLSEESELPDSISTQIYNRGDEIATLFGRGMGNQGKTLYDLYNGLTEWGTWGSGTSSKGSKSDNYVQSLYGTVNDIKDGFSDFLMQSADRLAIVADIGSKYRKDWETLKRK